jgi:hypothetical protein
MGQVIPRQHPAVVLKSQYKNLRVLLAALIAVVAVTAAVVILADDAGQTASTQPISHQQNLPDGARFDGGPDEGTRGLSSGAAPAPGTRFDGGPDEGTRGPQANPEQVSPLRSYEAQAGSQEPTGGPRFMPMGPSN